MNIRAQALDRTFLALAAPTRRAILARLADGMASVGELSRPFAISPPAISRHLRVLEQAGLIVRERHAQRRICRLVPERLEEAWEWLAFYRRFWESRFAELDVYLAAHPEGDPPDRDAP